MPANHLYTKLCCPRCSYEGEVEVEAEIDGSGFSKDYRVGDEVDWLPGELPPAGAVTVAGYVVCEVCEKDYFVVVLIADGVVKSVAVDSSREGYMK